MSDCIFCKITNGELPATKVYEDDEILAFNDIHPKASTHLLVIPKKHIPSMNELVAEDSGLISRMMLSIPQIAKQQGLDGYRVIANNGPGSGQMVFHLHFHILGGAVIPQF